VWELLSGAGRRLLLYLGLGAALGLFASWLMSRRIKRHTRGLEVAEIAGLADHREALLHSIREGVVAVNNEGDVTLLNDSAQELLGLGPDAVGRRVDVVGLDPAVVEFLLSDADQRDVVIATRTKVLALNRRSATSQGEVIGTVTTMRDSTELAALQGQLSSHKSVTDTLRAQTHEFANRCTPSPASYNSASTTPYATLSARSPGAARRSTTPSPGGYPIPRWRRCSSQRPRWRPKAEWRLNLLRSRTSALAPAVATDVITLLGNLIDNAVEVSVGSESALVAVRIDDRDGLAIAVADSGPGVPEHLREEIFARGATSKPDVPGGRGIGLALVRLVTAQHGGSVSVTDGDTGGALFAVRLPQIVTAQQAAHA
jgi:two-component system, CitB family, sensor kinase